MSIEPVVADPAAAAPLSPRTPADRRADAIAILAAAIIKTFIAEHAARCAAQPTERSPSRNQGEFALPERREEAVLSLRRGRAC